MTKVHPLNIDIPRLGNRKTQSKMIRYYERTLVDFATIFLLTAVLCLRVHAQTVNLSIVPITLHGVHIFVQAAINDQPVTLLLDTGASENFITPQAVSRLHLSMEKQRVSVTGAAGEVTNVPLVSLSKLSIGTCEQQRQSAFVVPLPDALLCDGCLGTPFLREWVVMIDYVHLCLTLIPRTLFTLPANTSVFPIRFYNDTPYVWANADGLVGWFQIDTGDGGAITLSAPFTEAHHLHGKYFPSLEMITGSGVGGQLSGEVVRLPQFTLGAFHFIYPVTELSRQTEGAFAGKAQAGNLGGEIWERFTVTLDYGSKRLYLKPNGLYDKPFRINRSGLALEFVHGTYTVRFVVANSPGAKSGLHVGDVVLAINQQSVDQIHSWELAEMLRQPEGTKLLLSVRAEDQSLRQVTLTLHDLL